MSHPRAHHFELITVGADDYWQPIALMIELMSGAPRSGAGEALPRASERSYASIVALLLVLMFEAYLGRVRHFDTVTPRDRVSGHKYFARLRGRRSAVLVRQVREAFLLRD